MKFVMNRDRTVPSTLGHVIEFKKDIPTHVPKALHQMVMEAGAVPEEELEDDPRDAKSPKGATAPEDGDERKSQILTAMELIADENKAESFSAGGVPSAKALQAALGWKVTEQERKELWVAFTQAKAAKK
jgi:hypothetical protein